MRRYTKHLTKEHFGVIRVLQFNHEISKQKKKCCQWKNSSPPKDAQTLIPRTCEYVYIHTHTHIHTWQERLERHNSVKDFKIGMQFWIIYPRPMYHTGSHVKVASWGA